MGSYLFTVHLWSIQALLTFPFPSTTQTASPGTRVLPGTTLLLCCSSLSLHSPQLAITSPRFCASVVMEEPATQVRKQAADLQTLLPFLSLDSLHVLHFRMQRAWLSLPPKLPPKSYHEDFVYMNKVIGSCYYWCFVLPS